MKRSQILLAVCAVGVLAVSGAGMANAGGNQPVNPECTNRYAVCPPKLKAKEKPDFSRARPMRLEAATPKRHRMAPQRGR